ncbi:MAG: protein kinase domain-containing protein [Kofleriaceae bacterium]
MTVPDTAPSSVANLASDGACPSEDDLVAMIEGALSAQQLAAIEKHVATCETCASVVGDLGALGDPGKPRAIDRYQLDRRIAAGGMGEVWAAWDPKLRREIAVKLVKPERSDDTRERDRLLREARALARLTHPNVIAVHDVGEQDGEVFIVSELVSGDTLANRGGPSADWRTVIRLYSQAARGLAAAHAAGLVHRDVKPANLLLGTDGRVRVADFGLAVRSKTNTPNETPDVDASLSIGQSITQRGHIAGTPAYMAPEQRAGLTVEAPADQFALCVALGEALAGRRPPMEITAIELVKFVGERRPMEPGLDALCGIIARGLAVLPAERFPDMASLADALDEIAPPIKVSGEHRAIRAPTGGIRALRTPTGTPANLPESTSVPEVPPTEKTRRRWSGTLVIGGVVVVAAVTMLILVVTHDRDRGLIATPRPTPSPTTPAPMPSPPVEDDHRATDNPVMPTMDAPAEKTVPRDPLPSEMMPAPSSKGGASAAPPVPTAPGPSAMEDTQKLVPSTTPAPAIAPSGITLDVVHAAIKRRDGRACRAALAKLTAPPPSDFRVASAHAICEMVAGNCEGGTREQRALYVREGTPPDSAEIIADLYCAVDASPDPAVRLRRLAKQIDLFATSFDCDEYLPHARAAVKDVKTDRDRQVLGGVLRDIAFCYSKREDCATARAILDDAKVFIPGFARNELVAACR